MCRAKKNIKFATAQQAKKYINIKLLILMHIQQIYHNFIYNRLPEDELSGSKHEGDFKN